VNVLEQLEYDAVAGNCTVFQFCTEVAKLFKLRPHEVAVFTLRHSMLQFAYPPELRSTGMIPLISSTQAARTASTKRAEIFNNFATVRHSSIFETIKVGGSDPLTIRKLMSVPIFAPAGEVIGVIQVCRKGATLQDAGPDFTTEDLHLLQDTAKVFGRVARQLQERGNDVTAPADPVGISGMPRAEAGQ
jgi:GAF domain